MRKLIALLLASMSIAAQASEWKVFDADKDMKSSIDISSITRRGTVVQFWSKFTYLSWGQSVNTGHTLSRTTQLNIIDCQNKILMVPESHDYDTRGNLDFSGSFPASYIEPDTMDEKKYNFVCRPHRHPRPHPQSRSENIKYL